MKHGISDGEESPTKRHRAKDSGAGNATTLNANGIEVIEVSSGSEYDETEPLSPIPKGDTEEERMRSLKSTHKQDIASLLESNRKICREKNEAVSNARDAQQRYEGLAASVKAATTCAYCNEVYCLPHVLVDCGHSICQLCIFQLIRGNQKGGDHACPQCGKKIKTQPVPNVSMEGLVKATDATEVKDRDFDKEYFSQLWTDFS